METNIYLILLYRGWIQNIIFKDGREKELPSDFVRSIENFRIRGSSGKVNLALDGLPDFTCLPGEGHHHRGAISISPDFDYLENAYDDAKYGNFSKSPFMDIILPSVLDPEMAPPGKHVMSCFVQYAPYDLKGGWNDNKREAFGDAVVNALARYAPNIKDIILHRQVLTPADLEDTFGLTEGNIFHGELTVQQLFSLRSSKMGRLYNANKKLFSMWLWDTSWWRYHRLSW